MRRIDAGVLVIGSGGAGMRAAIEASKNADVLLVSKGPLGRSGSTVLAGADVMADGKSLHDLGIENDSSDSPDAWARDIVIEGFGLNDENLVEAYVNGAGEEIAELVRLGVTIRRAIPRAIITTGMSICGALRKGIAERGESVSLLDNVMAIDLLTHGDRVVGALVLELVSGDLIAIQAKATILATGGWHQAYSFNAGPDEATGDGQAMAYRAGAELIDMEMVTFAPNILLAPPRHRGSLWFYVLPGALLNSNGDAFLAWENPKVAKLALTTEWNKLLFCKASMREVLAGRGSPLGGVFFSMKHMPSNVFDLLEGRHPGWRFQGDDFSELMERMRGGYAAEVGPAAEYFEGGVRINERCETSLPGLFAAGECTGGLFGANRVAAATTEMLVEGAIAGREAGRVAAKGKPADADQGQVEALAEVARSPFSREKGESVSEQRDRLREVAYRDVGVIREGSQLRGAVQALTDVVGATERIMLSTERREQNREWCSALELRNMAEVTLLSAMAAETRTESRGVHMRQDCPDLDNANWRKHIIARREGGAPKLHLANVVSSTELPAETMSYEGAIVQAAEALERAGGDNE